MKSTLEYHILKHLSENENGEFIDVEFICENKKFLFEKLKNLHTETLIYFPMSSNRIAGVNIPTKYHAKIKLKGIDYLNKLETTTIMSQTIINTSGDGNVVNTGDKAKIDATINIQKGNKEELLRHLQKNGISEQDTIELASIIDTEVPNVENKTFGKKVSTWTKKMIGNAVNGTWNIGIGAAGSLLAQAISKYYGI